MRIPQTSGPESARDRGDMGRGTEQSRGGGKKEGREEEWKEGRKEGRKEEEGERKRGRKGKVNNRLK